MLVIFDEKPRDMSPDIRIAAAFQDDPIFAPFRTCEIKKNKRVIKCVCNDIQAYFNAQRLAMFGQTAKDELIRLFNQAQMQRSAQETFDDDVLISATRERWMQSNADLYNYMRKAKSDYDSYVTDIKERSQRIQEEKKHKEEEKKKEDEI